MDLICVKKSTGELLAPNGTSYFGQGRPSDTVSVRSAVRVRVRFLADDLTTRVGLTPAAGVLTFSGQPTNGETFTVGSTAYTARSALSTGPTVGNEFLIGANLAASIANLVGALNATSGGGQTVGTTYSTGTAANPVASAAAYLSTKIVLTARYADASGNAVTTTTTSTHAGFGAATLSGADVLSFDIKLVGQYDADPTLASPVFIAPLDPAADDYIGTLDTNVIEAIALFEANNPAKGLLTFTAQPTAGDTFTVGAVTYTVASALTGAANEVLRGASLAAFLANLIGEVNASTASGQGAGTTYGTGTTANPLAAAAPGGVVSSILFTATAAGSTVPVATTEACSVASFGSTYLAAGKSTAKETDAVPLMAQLSWGPDENNLTRSEQWTLSLKNVLRHPSQGIPTSAAGPLTEAVVLQAVNQAAAAEPGVGAPTGTGVIGWLQRTAAGVTSWVTTSAFFRGLANLTKAQTASAICDGSDIDPQTIGATTPGTGRFTDLYPNFVFLGDGNITLNTDGSAGFAGLATFYGGISGDGSGLSGNAPDFHAGAADYAVYAGGADTAVVAYGASSSYGSDFDGFFHNSGYNSDISFPGGGCISLLYSDGHGVQMFPQASDGGLTLRNISDDTPATLTLGDLNASGFLFAAGMEVSGVIYADTLGSGTSLYGPGGFSASSTGLTMDFGSITTDGGGSLDVGGTLHVEGSIYTSDSFFFSDGSRLGVFDGQLVWTDADGTGHTLVTE